MHGHGHLLWQMEKNTKVCLKTIEDMVMAGSSGKMEESMMDSGKEVNNME